MNRSRELEFEKACMRVAARAVGILSTLLLVTLPALAQGTRIVIDSPMPPPDWALMERALLDANSRAVEQFAAKYIDSRGYLLRDGEIVEARSPQRLGK